MGMFLSREATFSALSKRKSTKALHELCYGNLTLVCMGELIVTQDFDVLVGGINRVPNLRSGHK